MAKWGEKCCAGWGKYGKLTAPGSITKGNPMQKIARVAGLLYLAMAVIGGFSLLYVPTLVAPGDAAATTGNIAASEFLFRLTAVSAMVAQVIFLALVMSLYRLFEGVNRTLSALMVILVVAAVPVAFLNVLNQFAVLQLLGDAAYATVFEPDQLNAAVMFFLDLHGHGLVAVEVFWGLWLLPFGLLILKSGFIPKILGILLIVACAGYLADVLVRLLFPEHAATISPVVGILKFGEPVIILWLLVMGASEKHTIREAATGPA